jgi:hypothetical protein
LRSQQSKSFGEFLLNFRGSQDVTLHKVLKILNQLGCWLERCGRVGEHNAVPADSGVG